MHPLLESRRKPNMKAPSPCASSRESEVQRALERTRTLRTHSFSWFFLRSTSRCWSAVYRGIVGPGWCRPISAAWCACPAVLKDACITEVSFTPDSVRPCTVRDITVSTRRRISCLMARHGFAHYLSSMVWHDGGPFQRQVQLQGVIGS